MNRKTLLGILLSLRTTIWLLLALLCLLLYGALVMPVNKEFQALHTVPLFPWLLNTPAGITWWLWASIAVLSLLTANTLFCSIESIVRKRETRQWLLIISPQIIHAGFLFILLAHLFSAYDSFRGTTFVSQGSVLHLPNGLTVVFDRINTDIDPSGYLLDWSSDIRYFREDRLIAGDSIRPNVPSFHDGLGIYIKTVRMDPFPSALIEVSRDAGAGWALAGGLLFLLGIITLLVLRMKREEIQ